MNKQKTILNEAIDKNIKTKNKKNKWIEDIKKDYDLYILLIPALVILVIFRYLPIYGASIAFKDYNLSDGISGSPWVGFKHFRELFNSPKFYSVFVNTLLINLYRFIFQFPLPIILALMLSEVKNMRFKKICQTTSYLPHFLSWVVISAIFINLLSPQTGIVNKLIKACGGKPIMFMTDSRYFRSILVISNAWRETGWGSIIYLAAISAIDPQLYEAAIVDGANKWRQTWHITLPGIRSTIFFIIVQRLGSALANDVEQVLMFYNSMVYDVGDVIGTYVYRIGLGQMQYSFTTAVGLFQSIIGFILVYIANTISRKSGEYSLW